MPAVWIRSVHNLHCPTCGSPLVERAGRYTVLDRPAPVYVGEVESLTCQEGCALPDRRALYAYRDLLGVPPSAPAREVEPPRRC